MQTADKLFDEKSLWWKVKLLSLLVTVDEELFADGIRAELRKIENQFAQKAENAEKEARRLITDGKLNAAKAI